MITINNKSRYFSASEDMFPTMERNFAWLFGMQTPEQGWKAAMAKAIYRKAELGMVDLTDFPLMTHVNDVLDHGKDAELPWDSFTFDNTK
jgi:hypothetical protein